MLWQLLVLVVILWFIQRRWQMRRQHALGKQLKTNLKTWPIIGHAYRCIGNGEDKMEDFVRASGKDAIAMGGKSKFCLYDRQFLCVADPVFAQIVMNKCLEKHDMLKIMDFLIGNSTIIAPVPIWRRRRKMLLPFLKLKNLASFFDVFSANSTKTINTLDQKAFKGTFSIWNYIIACISNSMFETVLDFKTNGDNKNFLTAIEELWSFLDYGVFRPWLWPQLLRSFARSFYRLHELRHNVRDCIKKIIKEKQKPEENKSDKSTSQDVKSNVNISSFLGLQLQKTGKEGLTDNELLEECITLIVAGSETSAICIGFVALLLSRHLDVQEKVYKELQEVFEDQDQSINLEDLSRLQYLEAVIKEVLRLYPPVPVLVRQVDKDVELPTKLTLVQDYGILINIWALHRNPTYWGDDAEVFRPERFLNSIKNSAFMPFSYGSRGCVGYRLAMMSMKTTLAIMLRRYRVLPPPGVQQGEPLKTEFSILMRHAENYHVQLERRK